MAQTDETIAATLKRAILGTSSIPTLTFVSKILKLLFDDFFGKPVSKYAKITKVSTDTLRDIQDLMVKGIMEQEGGRGTSYKLRSTVILGRAKKPLKSFLRFNYGLLVFILQDGNFRSKVFFYIFFVEKHVSFNALLIHFHSIKMF
jgi:hypothetical protein